MAESKGAMKINQLRPGMTGLSLTVKVVDSKLVMQRSRSDGPQRQLRMSECLVGDETGIIIFTARNDQVEQMKLGATLTLKNAKIDMFKGSMRLAVDNRAGGKIEVAAEEPSGDVSVKEDNNLSLIEFELVNIVEG